MVSRDPVDGVGGSCDSLTANGSPPSECIRYAPHRWVILSHPPLSSSAYNHPSRALFASPGSVATRPPVMTESYGLPLFFVASSRDLHAATFSDIYGRHALWTARFFSPDHCAMVTGVGTNTSPAISSRECHCSIVLDLNAQEESEWTISGGGKTLGISKYLKAQPETGNRSFTASDGQLYEWRYRGTDEQDPGWTCTSSTGYLVAHYLEESDSPRPAPPSPKGLLRKRSLKRSSTSSDQLPSGGMLVITESWTHIAEEIVATLIILSRQQRA